MRKLLLCIVIPTAAGVIAYLLAGLKFRSGDDPSQTGGKPSEPKEKRAAYDDELDNNAGGGSNKPKVAPQNVWRGGPRP